MQVFTALSLISPPSSPPRRSFPGRREGVVEKASGRAHQGRVQGGQVGEFMKV